MAKLNIDFVIVDEMVNEYGYRVLMSGYQPGRFESNPVLLLMHERATRGVTGDPLQEDVILPLGRWNNIMIEDGKLLGQPEFDDQDEMAMRVQNKVEKGYMNAASAWIIPLAFSDDPEIMIPGQTGPTITQWEIAEASIVDIPGCRNALAIRESGKLLKLTHNNATDFLLKLKGIIDMDFLKLAAKLVGLPETSNSKDVESRIIELVKNNTSESSRNNDLQLKLTEALDKLSLLEQSGEDQKIDSLIDEAVLEQRISHKESLFYRKLAKADFESTKALIDNRKPYQSIQQQLKDNQDGDELAELSKLTWDQLDQQNKLSLLKEKYPDLYKTKYKSTFNKDPKTV